MKQQRTCNEDYFISSIVIIVKEDGSLEMELHSNKLNEWVTKNKYQMANLIKLIDQIAHTITAKNT